MTPDRFRECLELIGWGQRALADWLGINYVTVRRWASGAQDIPPAVATWLERLADTHQAYPLPEGWQR